MPSHFVGVSTTLGCENSPGSSSGPAFAGATKSGNHWATFSRAVTDISELTQSLSGRQKTIDARSDIHALGAVTYEMLTGEPPFTGNSVQAIVAKVLAERPAGIRTLRDTVPASIEQVVMRALAKLPADRWTTVASFAAALTDRDVSNMVVANAESGRLSTRQRSRWRNSFVLALVATSAHR